MKHKSKLYFFLHFRIIDAKGNQNILPKMLTKKSLLSIKASKWNKAFTIDTIDLMLMMIDKRCFRGIFMQRQYPGKNLKSSPNTLTQ